MSDFRSVVHSNELEEKVCHRGEIEELYVFFSSLSVMCEILSGITYNDNGHSCPAFSTSPNRSHYENSNADWNGCNGQSEFGVFGIDHDDHKLNSESQEEKEIKLEESDVNLGEFC